MIRHFLFGLVVSFCVNWLLRPLIAKAGWVDNPKGRKKHMRPTVVSGGLGLFCAVALGLMSLNSNAGELWLSLSAISLMFVVGFLDDRIPIRARYRLLVQITVAIALVFGTGAVASRFSLSMNLDLTVVPWLVAGISVFFVVGLINAFNMSDGSDGVASGYGAIALSGLLATSQFEAPSALQGDAAALAAAVLLLGGLLGYIFFNYPLIRYRPARTFMGDGGSMVLGLVVGWVLLKAGSQTAAKPFDFWFAIWLVAMPVFDASYCILYRAWKRQDPFAADRRHVHHLLQKLRYSRRRLALTLHGFSLVLAAAGLGLWHWAVPAYVSLWLFLLAFVLYAAIVSSAWSAIGRLDSAYSKSRASNAPLGMKSRAS